MSQSANAKARAFLAAFRITGSVVLSAEAARVEKTIHYRWLARSKSYARDFAKAEIEFGDVLEAAAIKRAKDGELEPVFYQGAACGAVRKYSNGLMVHLLKRFKPSAYASRVSAELSGPGGAPISVRDPALQKLTDVELADLIRITAKLEDASRADGRAPRSGEAEN